MIEPGAIELTLWTDPYGEGPRAFDVAFDWDGHQSATWYADISTLNDGLSVMSSSPGHGILAWPDGKNVLLTYNWSDFSVEGHDILSQIASTDDSIGTGATAPDFWIKLGYNIVDFVLTNHGSGDARTEYLDTVDDVVLDLDEMFERYLLGNDTQPQSDFSAWLENMTSTGRYRLFDGE